VLTLAGKKARTVRIPTSRKFDAVFTDWFGAIPDTDVEAAKALEEQVRNDPSLGDTPEERLAALASARRLGKFAGISVVGLYFWGIVYPQPYGLLLAVLVTIPWAVLVIAARRPLLYSLGEIQDKSRPNLTPLIVGPGLVLFARALHDVHLLDWHAAATLTLALAVAYVVVLLRVRPAFLQRGWMTLLAGVLMLPYGYGATLLANAELDRSAVVVYPTRIEHTRVSAGRSRTPYVTVAAWGDRASPEEVSVSWDLYNQVAVGDEVCVRQRSGALRMSWYVVGLCTR
jgi:hypothetical protein